MMSQVLLTSKAAQQYADIDLLKRDLEHVITCCNFMLQAGQPPNLSDPLHVALMDSALVRYRRCFNSGGRQNIEHLAKKLSEGGGILHKKLMEIANLNIAHSINNFEENYAVLWADLEAVPIERSSPGTHGMRTMGIALKDLDDMRSLTGEFINLVEAWRQKLEKLLMAEIEKMTDDEIRSQPNGTMIHRTPNASSPRKKGADHLKK
ncbi:hypothetical protein [Hyphomicrobium sp.]|jgi:hypothetical protein|uniref:hypothetical protein n=1 Tax=Hyphomicrobium sp. TaxID=82 RepID=UPI003561C5F6